MRVALQAGAVVLVVALLGLLTWSVASGGGSSVPADVRAGKKPEAPPFELPLIWDDGRPADGRLALEQLRGKAVVLNFWASWCEPCKAEAPHLAAAAREHEGDVVVLGVDVQDFVGDARGFLEDVEAPYPSVRDGSDETYEAYGLTGVPETFYIDREGRIVAHSLGQVGRADVEAGIAEALR